MNDLEQTRKQKNLPIMTIPDSVEFTTEISEACKGKDVIMFALPSVYVRSTAEKASDYIPDGQIIVDVGKGIESETLLTLTEIIRDVLSKDHEDIRLVALSGPTHAEEVASDLPTTIVSACNDLETAEKVQHIFMNTCMRVYTNSDVLGVEICGALKNIIAIASGICDGLGFADNTRAT